MPVNYVSFYGTLRFANWLHNGQGSGDTETGAYMLLGATPEPSNGFTVEREASGTIFLASEDEWCEAAYYHGVMDHFHSSPTSESDPICATPGAALNTANCGNVVRDLTAVGSYTGSASSYGTFDQAGNVSEWLEADSSFGGFDRVTRGGNAETSPTASRAGVRSDGHLAANGNRLIGFRLSMIPEPGTGMLVTGGLAALAAFRSRVTRAGLSRAPDSDTAGWWQRRSAVSVSAIRAHA